jgi:hypothetical protein
LVSLRRETRPETAGNTAEVFLKDSEISLHLRYLGLFWIILADA